MQRVFRVIDTAELTPVGTKTTDKFNRSVRRYGIVSPILVAEVPDEDGVIGLSIIDGNRRVRAARSVGVPKVPAVVLKATSARDRARLTLICNYMRSMNFHTESAAIMALADDDEAAAQAARVMGVGPVKMQQLYRKIATMPEPVRQAMYEHRIPVSAATWVGNWPSDLQQEVVELLQRRRYLNTPALKALRTSYELRYPGVFQPERDVAASDEWDDGDSVAIDVPMPVEPPASIAAPASWLGGEDSSPAHGGGSAQSAPPDGMVLRSRTPEHQGAGSSNSLASRPVRPTVDEPDQRVAVGSQMSTQTTPAEPPGPFRMEPESTPAHPVAPRPELPGSTPAAPVELHREAPPSHTSPVSLASDVTAPDDPHDSSGDGVVEGSLPQRAPSPSESMSSRAHEGFAFILRLDSTLSDLAREAQERSIAREVWIDRAMRAWERLGAS